MGRFGRLAAASAALAFAAGAQGPENVLVVVNRSSAVSRAIAEYYAFRRSIPSRNVCLIEAPQEEEIAREVYDSRIAAPVAQCLKSRNLQERVLYIVTTLGVPLKIRGSGGISGDAAAVDSELTLLYGSLHGASYAREGPLANPFFRARSELFSHPRFPIYLVTRLAAYSLPEVKAMVDRSLAAKNTGRFVLDLNSEGDQDGNAWLRDAAVRLPADRVILEESTAVLYNQREVIGYAAWGSNDRNRKRRFLGFEWLAGAIATEFVSSNGRTFAPPPEKWDFSANFAGTKQSLTADYIHEGATGASGHVYEPFLRFTPRPDLLFPAYYAGRNLAESFYLSMPALSWQNIVVGDPLCSLGPPQRRR